MTDCKNKGPERISSKNKSSIRDAALLRDSGEENNDLSIHHVPLKFHAIDRIEREATNTDSEDDI